MSTAPCAVEINNLLIFECTFRKCQNIWVAFVMLIAISRESGFEGMMFCCTIFNWKSCIKWKNCFLLDDFMVASIWISFFYATLLFICTWFECILQIECSRNGMGYLKKVYIQNNTAHADVPHHKQLIIQ